MLNYYKEEADNFSSPIRALPLFTICFCDPPFVRNKVGELDSWNESGHLTKTLNEIIVDNLGKT
jgi:hypothetical protein